MENRFDIIQMTIKVDDEAVSNKKISPEKRTPKIPNKIFLGYEK
jgi:hypothetical protein